ncbi:hypothetical protein ACG1BZ_09715 [Microbulbifer sp. CNSA002]|uniref:hypothetical protein n=1 Tax=unclassified Microbulbifer TaxID=2619833 RepID=UPI0039B61403
MNIKTPHIPLNIELEEALGILRSTGLDVLEKKEDEDNFYRVSSPSYECGFYEKENRVIASWYNDPSGRESEDGITQKLNAYLQRYGELSSWESGINNGWIQFFQNEDSSTSLAYGLHKDVLRFNYIRNT